MDMTANGLFFGLKRVENAAFGTFPDPKSLLAPLICHEAPL